ncbi:MAG: hypothetical protein GXO87_06445 [Chlorobi bacterium]|nr:hypothetical protein [Chlorobiota bacterium]
MKIRTFLSALSFVLLFAGAAFGQDAKTNYKLQLDSLTSAKEQLSAETAKLKAELDSLQNYLASFDDRLNLKKQELMLLRYGKKTGGNIAAGKVWKGMTEQMLRDSWGEPDKIDKNVEKWGVFTQWSYGKITYFFRDGKLTDWEEKK